MVKVYVTVRINLDKNRKHCLKRMIVIIIELFDQ